MIPHLIRSPDTFKADRPLHHIILLEAFQIFLNRSKFTIRHKQSTLRKLNKVFGMVQIGDPDYPSVLRSIDTFDVIDARLASRIVSACHQYLPTEPSVRACFKAIKSYCQFLQDFPMIDLPGQAPIVIQEQYGPINCPINRYRYSPYHHTKPPNFNYLSGDEYKQWLFFTSNLVNPAMAKDQLLKFCQLHLLCTLAGETGMRLQELIGLDVRDLNLVDATCGVMKGKGSKGSGPRKREVPLSRLAILTVKEFLKQFPRKPGESLVQNTNLQRLSINTAHGWMRELKQRIKAAQLPIYLDQGFGWHAFRRTFARRYVERGGSRSIETLKLICGWSYTSTLSHYMGDPKPTLPVRGFPLDWEKTP